MTSTESFANEFFFWISSYQCRYFTGCKVITLARITGKAVRKLSSSLPTPYIKRLAFVKDR